MCRNMVSKISGPDRPPLKELSKKIGQSDNHSDFPQAVKELFVKFIPSANTVTPSGGGGEEKEKEKVMQQELVLCCNLSAELSKHFPSLFVSF